jgi:hypothetical protein
MRPGLFELSPRNQMSPVSTERALGQRGRLSGNVVLRRQRAFGDCRVFYFSAQGWRIHHVLGADPDKNLRPAETSAGAGGSECGLPQSSLCLPRTLRLDRIRLHRCRRRIAPSMQEWRISLRESAAGAARHAITSSYLCFSSSLLLLGLRFERQAQAHRFFLDECRRSPSFLDDFFQRFRGAAKLHQPPVVLERPMPFSDHHENLGSDKAVKRSMFA